MGLFARCEVRMLAANAMLVLIVRAMVMLDAQLKRLGADFLEEGGFRERMHRQRNAAREASAPDAPTCPQCGKAMRRRSAQSGPRAGEAFWGCSDYPQCRATRPWKQDGDAVTLDTVSCPV